MKKIGICTLYFAHNFGAILQAFALQETLKNMGYEVEFLKIREQKKDANCKKNNYEGFEKSMNFLNICDEVYNANEDYYDAIIVGSDEVWNTKNQSFEHLDEYLGYDLNSNRKITYAPSANTADVESLRNVYGDKLNFSNFDFISARDKNTYQIVKDVSGREATMVLDPTLLVKSYDKYIKYKEPHKKDYIIVYGYGISDDEKRKINNFAKKYNKKVYSLGFEQDWCETLYADIFEFLGYIKNADYVISNSFHGTIFSIILEKEFAAFTRNNSKVIDILNKFNLSDRDGYLKDDLFGIFDKKIDYKNVNNIKLEKRKESLNYLENALA